MIAKVGDIELDYERSGSGEPLLLIMGMSGTALMWGEPFLSGLREQFDVIAFDNRGVGSSTRLEGEATIAQMARDAIGLLDALEIERAHVLGISMGGMIAQELALAAPERVITLTLGCTYCGGEGSALASQQVIEKLTQAMMSGDRARAIRAGWEVNVSQGFAADEQAFGRFSALAERRPVAVPVVMAQMQACLGHDTNARLAAIELPTLVIHGTRDEMLPVANGHMIAERIQGSRLEIFDEVGHLFFWERPERAAELVREHAAAVRA